MLPLKDMSHELPKAYDPSVIEERWAEYWVRERLFDVVTPAGTDADTKKFTMLLPPLFPTLLRTTGAGFSYNIGRIAAAVGTVFAVQISRSGNFRQTLFYTGFLFLLVIPAVLLLPRSTGDEATATEPVD